MKKISLAEFNQLSNELAAEALLFCCGSSSWVREMALRRPFKSLVELKRHSSQVWNALSERDWKEAFSHHPKIGDLKSLKEKFAGTKAWAEEEQKGSQNAPEEVLKTLARRNETYENRFGFIFIVCATGKSAAEMLENLERRLKNTPQAELKVAALEQDKITQIRLEKFIYE